LCSPLSDFFPLPHSLDIGANHGPTVFPYSPPHTHLPGRLHSQSTHHPRTPPAAIQTSEHYVRMANGQRHHHRDTFTFVKNTGYSAHRGKTPSYTTYLGDRRQSVPTLHLFPCRPKLPRERFTNGQLHASRHTSIISTCPTRDAFGIHLTPPPGVHHTIPRIEHGQQGHR
jgi:hypothetical protein